MSHFLDTPDEKEIKEGLDTSDEKEIKGGLDISDEKEIKEDLDISDEKEIKEDLDTSDEKEIKKGLSLFDKKNIRNIRIKKDFEFYPTIYYNGKSQQLNCKVRSTMTIGEFRSLVQDLFNCDDKVDLSCRSPLSCDDKTLYDYGIISSYSVIVVIVRLRGGCFLAGTKVLLSNNTLKNIEDINTNDQIISFDVNKKVLKEDYVTNTYKFEVNNIVIITLSNNNIIITTPDHPFYIADLNVWGCVELNDNSKKLNYIKINIGQNILIYNDNRLLSLTIANIQLKYINKPVIVHTFSTHNYHNYFANNILVHNKIEFKAPDVEQINWIQTGNNSYHYYTVTPGLNYKGICKNPKCNAGKNEEPIIMNRGFGEIRPNEDQLEGIIKCPGKECNQEFELSVFYFYKCEVHTIWKKKGELKQQKKEVAKGDKILVMGSNNGDQPIYEMLKFDVKKLQY